MTEEIRTKKESEEKKAEDKKSPEIGEKTEDRNPDDKRSWFMEHVEATASRAQEILGSDGGAPEGQEKKKEASQAMSTMGFGTATLGGLIALAFAGMVLGVQKLNAWSKSFETGVKLAYPGGGKGGGGKKEKG